MLNLRTPNLFRPTFVYLDGLNLQDNPLYRIVLSWLGTYM